MAISLGKGNQDSSSSSSSDGFNVGNTGNTSGNISGNLGMSDSGNFGYNTGTSSGGSFSQSSSNNSTNVWKPQQKYLKDMYGQAQDALGQSQGSIEGLTPEVQAQMSSALGNAINSYGQQANGGFSGGVLNGMAPNGYTDQLQAQVLRDAGDIKSQNLAQLDARAAAAGMSGSSGYRDQVGNMMDDVDQNAMNTMANIGNTAYQQNIQNQLSAAGQADMVTNNAVNNLGNIQQGAMAQFQPGMMGQQAAALYGQTLGGPTMTSRGSSQSTGGSSQSSNNFGMNAGYGNSFNMGLGMGAGYGFGNNFGGTTSDSTSNSDGTTTKIGVGG